MEDNHEAMRVIIKMPMVSELVVVVVVVVVVPSGRRWRAGWLTGGRAS